MTAFPNAMATRNRFLTTAKALDRALRQAEFDTPATDPAPFFFSCSVMHARANNHHFRGTKGAFGGRVSTGIPLCRWMMFMEGRSAPTETRKE